MPPGRGSAAGRKFSAPPYYSQRAMFASLSTFRHRTCSQRMGSSLTGTNVCHWYQYESQVAAGRPFGQICSRGQQTSCLAYLGRINSFLKRAFKYGLCSQLFSFLDLADDADQTLFNSMLQKQNCLQVILPEVKTSSLHLRQKGHVFDLPRCTLEIHRRSFLPHCLFKFI